MASANSTRTSRATKGDLWFHAPSGYWCKKIRGKRHYFSKDKDEALRIWEAQKADLLAGRKPQPANPESLTVKQACNHLLTHKENQVEAGELSQRQFQDLLRASKLVVSHFGPGRLVEDLRPDDFRDLRAKMSKRYGATSLKREIGNVRQIFNFAFKNDLVDRPPKFGTQFSGPTKKALRQARHDAGERMLEAHQLRQLLEAAPSVHTRAQILLALNLGLGNADLAFLEKKHLDLDAGWITYPRRKTAMPRKAKLWAETVRALRESIQHRPKHKDPQHADLVFITKYGKPWGSTENRNSPLSAEFRKLLHACKLYRKGISFYTLRHVYRTVADECMDPSAADLTMGHARDDMASLYRERISDERLERVASHVRRWLFGEGVSK